MTAKFGRRIHNTRLIADFFYICTALIALGPAGWFIRAYVKRCQSRQSDLTSARLARKLERRGIGLVQAVG